jgi:hypothetical protein
VPAQELPLKSFLQSLGRGISSLLNDEHVQSLLL